MEPSPSDGVRQRGNVYSNMFYHISGWACLCNSVDFRQPPRKLRLTGDKSNFSVAIKHQTLMKILNNKGPPPTLPDTTCGQSPLHSKYRPYFAETFSKIKKRGGLGL